MERATDMMGRTVALYIQTRDLGTDTDVVH